MVGMGLSFIYNFVFVIDFLFVLKLRSEKELSTGNKRIIIQIMEYIFSCLGLACFTMSITLFVRLLLRE